MPPISRKRLARNDTNRTLRSSVKASKVRTPRVRSLFEQASEMSKRISQKKPSPFDGKGEPSELKHWLREFDKLFDVVECLEELKVNQAAFYLTGEVDYWWANSKAGLLEQADGDLDWGMFKRAMREKFLPAACEKGQVERVCSIRDG